MDRYHLEERQEEVEKMEAYAKHCDGFERGLHLVDREVIGEKEANKIKDCYQVLCPVIDTSKYLLWLHLLALSLGVKIHQVIIRLYIQMIINVSHMGQRPHMNKRISSITRYNVKTTRVCNTIIHN